HVRALGQGRFGRVWLVTHRQEGTVLALKQLPKASTTLRGFLYEFCVGLSLGSHAAIVAACGVGLESADSYSFLTEPVLHGDLIGYIRPKVGLPQAAAQRCAAQLASALEHIHSLGLVYRDLKPENVLVCDPDCRQVKALDAWALGVLLFCLLTGYFPWDQPLAETDPFYEDFVVWQASGQPDHRPRPCGTHGYLCLAALGSRPPPPISQAAPAPLCSPFSPASPLVEPKLQGQSWACRQPIPQVLHGPPAHT
ncbi:hypothetical protein K5549_019744, partial [Capra hircus]